MNEANTTHSKHKRPAAQNSTRRRTKENAGEIGMLSWWKYTLIFRKERNSSKSTNNDTIFTVIALILKSNFITKHQNNLSIRAVVFTFNDLSSLDKCYWWSMMANVRFYPVQANWEMVWNTVVRIEIMIIYRTFDLHRK